MTRVEFRVAFILLLCTLASAPIADQAHQSTAAANPPKTVAPVPWPDGNTLAERRREAETRLLFAREEPLEFTLIADFKAVNRDRNPESTQTFPATIVITRTDGTPASIALQIRTRGHSRRKPQTCSFAPLRLEFQRDHMTGTALAGPRTLKLGTHCRNDGEFEQYVLREYAAYRIFNLLTPRSFRVRLAKATYVDAASKKNVARRYAMFIEDEDDVARRMEGRISDAKGILFRRADSETVTLMTLFEYMIGNTDMSMTEQHNIRIVETPASTFYPVPYDFDYAGLVNAVYAAADKRLGITSVRERLYRGPCRTAGELDPLLARMRAVKSDVMALYDGLADFNNADRREAKAYLDEFYRTIDRPRDIKREFIDRCVIAGM